MGSTSDLGLPYDTVLEGRERHKLFVEWLWNQRTRNGRNIVEVLRFVLWEESHPPAERMWRATLGNDPEWAMPHFGISSLGELMGWARPDEYPPRNNRVSRALYALGYDVRRYND